MKLSSINDFDRTHVLNDQPVDPDATTDPDTNGKIKRETTIQDKMQAAISQNSTRLKLFDQRMDKLELALRKMTRV